MAFAPDGRLFLCEKQGRILVVKNDALLATPLIDFSDKVDSWNERGLGGLCFDPDFARNGYIYVYYTAKSPSHNRVSRLTVVGDAADAASEKVILELNPLSEIGWHNGGGLCFGEDGCLYVATGENANGNNAQDSGNLLGKLLRLNADGSIPKDNPNYDRFEGQQRAIVAMGLRNPFSIVAQKGSGLIYINNVGAKYEEIERYDSDVTPVHLNYGWPNTDGPAPGRAGAADYRNPAYAYDHGSGGGTALCGADFYAVESPAFHGFPASYRGAYFFSDYRGWIKYIDPTDPAVRHDFATGIDRPIDVEFAPDGAMWYIARAGQGGGSDQDNTSTSTGSLWRVEWTGSGQPAKLEFVKQPTARNVGEVLLPAVRVAVKDDDGRVVSSSQATVQIALREPSEPAVLKGVLTRKAIKGVATFDGLRITSPGEGYRLVGASGDLTPCTSQPISVRPTVATPAIAPRSGSYSHDVWVQIVCDTPDAVIRYTTDGSEPTAASPRYTEPVRIARSSVVKAYAERRGLQRSKRAVVRLSVSAGRPYGMDYRPQVAGVNMPAVVDDRLPRTLSRTGLFGDLRSLAASPGIVPYGVNSPLWSDNADKLRWVALPGDGRIEFAEDGGYRWPGGSIFVKHFDLTVNEQTNEQRRVETRVLVLDQTGRNGYGVTYKWRDDHSDADLLPAELDEQIEVVGADGTSRRQTWHYPSRQECLQCHTQKSGFVLGPNTRQLNGDYAYPTGVVDNQLRTWSYLQMFSNNIDQRDIAEFDHLVTVDDPHADLELRVRSYVDANCAFCHRPGGTGAQWDARFDTPIELQQCIGGSVRETFGIAGAKVVSPANLQTSILYLRMTSSQPTQRMPPVGRNKVDAKAVATFAEWIESLTEASGNGLVSGRAYYIQAKHSGKRLEVPAESVDQDQALLQQWRPRSGAGRADQIQQWRIEDAGNGWWRLTNLASGKVLDVPGNSTANSAQLQQYRDNGGDNQRWSITPNGDGYYVITSKQSGKNLDVEGASTADGAAIHQYQPTAGDNQLWSIVSPE
ncbi:MAG: RICIN domain-containing protein [Planctomycetales bacterium]|nr:RICIN domain-containing protein [Planctomycetales bacterium]